MLLSLAEEVSDFTPIFRMPLLSSGIGSVTALEAHILTVLLRVVQPRLVFEFGTFLGYSTALFALNSPIWTRIISIDLPKDADLSIQANMTDEETLHLDDIANDRHLRAVRRDRGHPYLSNLSEGDAVVELLEADTRNWMPSKCGLIGSVDFVFVDGGHDYETVSTDSRNAVEMLSSDGLIVWHDTFSEIHGEVTRVLLDQYSHLPLFHVEHTLLTFFSADDSLNRRLTAS